MNIVHIVPTGAWSGSEKIAFNFSNYLSDLKGVNSYIAIRTNNIFDIQFYKINLSERVKIIDIPKTLKGAKAIADYIEEFCKRNGDIIDIAHGHLGLGCRISACFNKSVYRIGHMHIRFFTPQFKNLDAVVAVSEWQLKDVPLWYEGDTYLVPNFIDELQDLTANELLAFKRRCYIKETDFVFGVISRLHLEKGVDLAIDAFKSIDIADIKLIIVGDGINSKYFKELAYEDSRIIFTGFISNASNYMQYLNCLVSPSRADSFGLSVLEGLYSEIPVVSTSTMGSMDIMKDDPLLCRMDDAKALAEKMMQAYNGQKNTCDYKQYNMVNSCKKMISIYASALEKIYSSKVMT
jgi:glycosyltransferase involved in cell wall biosynthesis